MREKKPQIQYYLGIIFIHSFTLFDRFDIILSSRLVYRERKIAALLPYIAAVHRCNSLPLIHIYCYTMCTAHLLFDAHSLYSRCYICDRRRYIDNGSLIRKKLGLYFVKHLFKIWILVFPEARHRESGSGFLGVHIGSRIRSQKNSVTFPSISVRNE